MLLDVNIPPYHALGYDNSRMIATEAHVNHTQEHVCAIKWVYLLSRAVHFSIIAIKTIEFVKKTVK